MRLLRVPTPAYNDELNLEDHNSKMKKEPITEKNNSALPQAEASSVLTAEKRLRQSGAAGFTKKEIRSHDSSRSWFKQVYPKAGW